MNKTKLTPRILSKTWNLPLNEMQKILAHCNIFLDDDAPLTKEQCLILKNYMSDVKKKQQSQKEADLQETTIVAKKDIPQEVPQGPIRKVKDLSSKQFTTEEPLYSLDDEVDDSDIPGINTFIKDNISSAVKKMQKFWKKLYN